MSAFNLFRVLGDFSHLLSKIVLIRAMHASASANGVSYYSQALYAVVFCARYLDLFWTPIASATLFYNFVLKVLYIASSFYTLYLIRVTYGSNSSSDFLRSGRLSREILDHSDELSESGRLAKYSLIGCAAACLPVTFFFRGWSGLYLSEIIWTFSIILESICILPQLILLVETQVVSNVIDSYYLLALGAYRGLYVLNWLYRGAIGDGVDMISVIFGVIQTILYIDFLFIYLNRQQIKLFSNILDSKDLSRGLFVGKFINRFCGASLRIDDQESGVREQINGPDQLDIRQSEPIPSPQEFDVDAQPAERPVQKSPRQPGNQEIL